MSDQPFRPTVVRWWVVAALCAITTVNYVQRNCIGGLETSIRSDLALDKEDTGLAIGAFFWAYALFQIPSGALAKRIGPRRALALYCAGWSLATAGLALATGIYDLAGYRILMGILQAGIFPCATLIMVAWLPVSRRAFVSALLNSFMLIGGAIVFNLTAVLLKPLGWRWLIVAYSLPGFVLAIGFYLWFRNRPEQHSWVNDAELEVIGTQPDEPGRTAARSPTPWLAAILSLSLWLICVQQFCRAGANRFVDSWLSTYLQEEQLQDIADVEARKARGNDLASAPQYAGVIGGLVGGLISDWLLRRTQRRRIARNGVAIGSLIAAVVCYLPIFFISDSKLFIAVFSMGYFVSAFAAPCAYALSMDIGGKNLPLVFGAMNMFGNFGAAAMAQIVPKLVKHAGGWPTALGLFVGVHAIAAVCWFILSPNRTIGENSDDRNP